MATKASTEEYDIVIIDSGSTRAWLKAVVEEKINGGNPAVPGDDEIRSGVCWRIARAARYPWDSLVRNISRSKSANPSS